MNENLTNLFGSENIDPSIQPIIEAIEQIMELPEESITPETIDIIKGMLNGAMTPKVREDSVQELIKNFEASNWTRAQAQENISNSKKAMNKALADLNPSDGKKQLLDGMFDIFYEIMDKAVDLYHNYAIELPIKLDKDAKMPTYAHDTDACADIYALEDTTIKAHTFGNKIRTGLYLGTPEGWQVGILPRSSIGANTPLRLSNSRAVIDQDYRGEIIVLYDNISDSDYTIKAEDRIAQMFVQPVYRFKPLKVDILPATERGEGGLGSTGK